MAVEDMWGNKITLEPEEAMLIDYVLTLHSFNMEHLDWLSDERINNLRACAGQVICSKEKGMIISDEDVALLLILVPITFRFDEKDVGYSLKVKLLKTHLRIEDEKNDDKTDNETINPPCDSASAEA